MMTQCQSGRRFARLLVCSLLLAGCGRMVALKAHDLDGVAAVQVPEVFERVPGVADNHAGEEHPFLPPIVALAQHIDREKVTFYFTASTYHDVGGNRHVGELLAITLYHQPSFIEDRVQDHLAYALDHALTLDVQWPRVATREEAVPNAQGGTQPAFSEAEIAWQDPVEDGNRRIDIGTGSYPYVGFFTAGAQREARVYVLTDVQGRFRLVYASQKSHRSRKVALDWLDKIAGSVKLMPQLGEHFTD